MSGLTKREATEVRNRLLELSCAKPWTRLGAIDADSPDDGTRYGWRLPCGIEVEVSLETGRVSMSIDPYSTAGSIEMAMAQWRFAEAKRATLQALTYVSCVSGDGDAR